MNRIQIFTLGYLCVVLCVGFISCSKDSATPTTPTPATCSTVSSKYATDVAPIIAATCATNTACHAAGGSSPVLTNYSQVSTNKANISSAVSSGRMPKGSTLTADQKNKILCWISGGALDN